MNLAPAFPTFIVTLREGFEAALVVGIVMACLRQVKQTNLYRQVYLGIGIGIFGSVILGFLLAIIIQSIETNGGIYTSFIKQLLASIVGIIAIAMLSWMLLWMSKQAKFLKTNIQDTVKQILKNQNAGRSILLCFFRLVTLCLGSQTKFTPFLPQHGYSAVINRRGSSFKCFVSHRPNSINLATDI